MTTQIIMNFITVFCFTLAVFFLMRRIKMMEKTIILQAGYQTRENTAHIYWKDAYDTQLKACQDLTEYIQENHNMRHDLDKCLIALSDKDLRSFGILHIPYIEEKINLILKGTMTFHPSVEQEYCNRQIFLSGKDVDELKAKV